MIKINNFSGADLGLEANGQSYVLPSGKSEIKFPDGTSYSLTFNTSGSGSPPPPGTNTFTSFGTLTVWEDSYHYAPAESSLFYLFEGFVLGVVVFGGGWLIRIVRNTLRETPV